jgi:electron transport complex protein RnfC
MMGIAQTTIEVPITKGSSGILCLDEKEGHVPKPQNCIRCGKCVDICPAFLQPLYISAHSLKYDYENAESYRALDCIECGSCSFICPARRPLLPSIRVAKREIVAIKRKQQASK